MTTYSTETLTRKRQTYHVLGIFFLSSFPVGQIALRLPKKQLNKNFSFLTNVPINNLSAGQLGELHLKNSAPPQFKNNIVSEP